MKKEVKIMIKLGRCLLRSRICKAYRIRSQKNHQVLSDCPAKFLPGKTYYLAFQGRYYIYKGIMNQPVKRYCTRKALLSYHRRSLKLNFKFTVIISLAWSNYRNSRINFLVLYLKLLKRDQSCS